MNKGDQAMTMQPQFDGYVGESIEIKGWTQYDNPDFVFDFHATLEYDDLNPEDIDAVPGGIYDPDDPEYGTENRDHIAAFYRGEWCYVGLVVRASFNGVDLGVCESLWGIELNPFMDTTFLNGLLMAALREAEDNAHDRRVEMLDRLKGEVTA
jgi:hypothetical protein